MLNFRANLFSSGKGLSSVLMSCLACLACQGLCSGAACLVSCCGRTAPLHHGVRLLYFVFFLATSVAAWALAAFGQDVTSSSVLFSPFLSFSLVRQSSRPSLGLSSCLFSFLADSSARREKSSSFSSQLIFLPLSDSLHWQPAGPSFGLQSHRWLCRLPSALCSGRAGCVRSFLFPPSLA